MEKLRFMITFYIVSKHLFFNREHKKIYLSRFQETKPVALKEIHHHFLYYRKCYNFVKLLCVDTNIYIFIRNDRPMKNLRFSTCVMFVQFQNCAHDVISVTGTEGWLASKWSHNIHFAMKLNDWKPDSWYENHWGLVSDEKSSPHDAWRREADVCGLHLVQSGEA